MVTLPSTAGTSEKKQWKLYIDTRQVQTDEELAEIIYMLQPKIAEPCFLGFRYLMARYDNPDTAYCRALEIECAVYCGVIEVEEVRA